MTTTEMLTATFNRLTQLQTDNNSDYPIFYCGKSFDIDSVGKVHCFLHTAQGANTFMLSHWKRKWKLNGKVISATNLQKIVGA